MKIFCKINYYEEALFEIAFKGQKQDEEKSDVDKEENERRADKVRTGGVVYKTNKPVTY
jgi:hypothetical protein